MQDIDLLPEYHDHPGTIRIRAETRPKSAASCAIHYIENAIAPVQFVAFGANAMQQAVKAMTMATFMFEEPKANNGNLQLSFKPILFRTVVADPRDQSPVNRLINIWELVVSEIGGR